MTIPKHDDKIPFQTCLLTILSLLIWCYLFRFFLNGSAILEEDAFPYFGHVRFYLDNMMNGVYPLWDPLRENGNVNEFFLRRIGEFNPFFWLIVVLNKLGLSFTVSHRLFLGGYYFGGITGFYLLSRRLFKDRQLSLISALILLFSSLGTKAFSSFILLEIVPAIWFIYCLVAFFQTPQRVFLLCGIFFLMIINITYVPFYFYTVFLVFLFWILIVYAPQLKEVIRPVKKFCLKNGVFIALCAGLWLASLAPGYLWYESSRQGEALSLGRHAGSQDVNSATVAINKVNEGGILAYLILDRQFVHLDKLRLGDFYVPVFIFLALFSLVWLKLTRRMVFLFLFGTTIFLIGITDASRLHTFLYNHLPFFKYFRNLQFFLWLGVLPVFVLLVVEALKLFIEECGRLAVIGRRWMSAWVALIHAGAGIFCLYFGTTGWTVYAVIALSLIWMLGQLWQIKNSRLWLWVLWLAIILQPVEVYNRFATVYPPSPTVFSDYQFCFSRTLSSRDEIHALFKKKMPWSGQPYFSTKWFYEAAANLDHVVMSTYMEAQFIAYDTVEQQGEPADFKRIEQSMDRLENIAFVDSDHAPSGKPRTSSLARIMVEDDSDFKVLKFDANSMAVKTAFKEPKFLVKTSNYHSRWKAFIDGKPAELFRTNIFAQGLWVPAGEHVIDWRFERPWRSFLAFILAILYLGVLVSVLWLAWRSKKSLQD
jgi:hypothetical protein